MKNLLLISLIGFNVALAQDRWKSTTSSVSFYSKAPMEDIKAINEKSSSVLDVNSKNIVAVIPIKEFQFKKKLMQEHFNENYMESDEYPNAIFKGSITKWEEKDGTFDAIAIGEMEIHGVKRKIEISGVVEKEDGKIIISSVFPIRLEDYDIKIPTAVFYKIAEEVEVTIKFEYAILKN